mmetsp:Transcript_25932/g.82137  ORF Transcript_25932/g.82137 Transcript_25932/m.82137 type:complete len:248 (+) Transcript_25932:1943-2686(+)
MLKKPETPNVSMSAGPSARASMYRRNDSSRSSKQVKNCRLGRGLPTGREASAGPALSARRVTLSYWASSFRIWWKFWLVLASPEGFWSACESVPIAKGGRSARRVGGMRPRKPCSGCISGCHPCFTARALMDDSVSTECTATYSTRVTGMGTQIPSKHFCGRSAGWRSMRLNMPAHPGWSISMARVVWVQSEKSDSSSRRSSSMNRSAISAGSRSGRESILSMMRLAASRALCRHGTPPRPSSEAKK